MRTGVSIGASESLALKGALLVYEGRHGSFVSWHDAKFPAEAGAPYLGKRNHSRLSFFESWLPDWDRIWRRKFCL